MPDEDKKQRVDREQIELLNELGGAPRVQVLFAFLLTGAFAQRFSQVSGLQRAVYFVALLATAVASVLFITPTAYHRLRWGEPDKEQMLFTANRLTIAGIGGLLAWFGYALPLSRRLGSVARRR